MKFLIVLILLLCLLRCMPYKEYNSDKTHVDIKLYLNKVAGVSDGPSPINHIKQLPWRWRKSELFKYKKFVYDSLSFSTNAEANLFLRATYNKKEREGTIVYQTKNTYQSDNGIYCIVFKAKNGYFRNLHYSLQRKPTSWTDVELLLPTAGQRIFGGRVATTKKEIRKLRRQAKHYHHQKQ